MNLINYIFRMYWDFFISALLITFQCIQVQGETRGIFQDCALVFERSQVYCKFSYCEFQTNSVNIFLHVVSKYCIMVEPTKVKSICGWTKPMSPTQVCNVIGLAIYYMQFVQSFATIRTPMTRFTRKEILFEWSESCEVSFLTLKDFLLQILF